MNEQVKEFIKKILYKAGYRLSKVDGWYDYFNFDAFLHSYLRNHSNLFFIQIGANDGVRFDPFYHFITNHAAQIKGIVVEPLGDYYSDLKQNYRDYPGIIPVQAAIHNTLKEKVLYRINPDKASGAPDWAKGIASFDADHHKLSGIPSAVMTQEKVRCISFSELLNTNNVAKVDLLQIDTEGYDAEIIQSIDFDTVKPMVIHFEHAFSEGGISRAKLLGLMDLLHQNNYELALEENDAIAYQRSLILDP